LSQLAVDDSELTERLAELCGFGAADPEDQQTRLGWPPAIISDALAWIRDESASSNDTFELALSGRVCLSRQQLRRWIEGRHVRPRRDTVVGEQIVKLDRPLADS
jgi:hypothetical protein